jgi:plastocyanin
MPRLLPVLATVLVLGLGGLAVTGCGSDDSSSSDAPATTAAAPPTTPADGQQDPATGGATAEAGGTVAISMKNIAFDPKTQAVKVGDKVVWTNDDDVQHNVVADTGADFESKTFGKGGTYEYTPTKAGTITYECTIHPGMTGTLVVAK